MTICDEAIAAVLFHLSGQWSCRALAEDAVLVTGASHYSDADAVELIARVDGDDIVVTDGGETLARLELAGVNVEAGRARQMWQALLRAHELEHSGGRLYRRGSLASTGEVLHAMAEAMINLDGLRLLAPAPSQSKFADRLVTFLQAEFEFVSERPELLGRSGIKHRVTAVTGTPDLPVYIQALAGGTQQSRNRAVEHGFTVFSDVNGALRLEQKIVVLSDETTDWNPARFNLLATVAYVGSWRSRDRLISFIESKTPLKSQLLFAQAAQEEIPRD